MVMNRDDIIVRYTYNDVRHFEFCITCCCVSVNCLHLSIFFCYFVCIHTHKITEKYVYIIHIIIMCTLIPRSKDVRIHTYTHFIA